MPFGQHEKDYALQIFSPEALNLVQRIVTFARKKLVTYMDMTLSDSRPPESSFTSTPEDP